MVEVFESRGFIPTIESHSYQGDTLVLHTTDEREETDLVSEKGEPLERKGDLATEEQKEVLSLYERN
jgi:hypothetical protein